MKGDQPWGWYGFDERKVNGIPNIQPSIKVMSEMALEGMTTMGMFLLFFPKIRIDTILKETNKNLAENPVTFGELLRFFWILLFMLTISGFSKRDFWSSTPVSVKSGAPYRFHEWMSLQRFDNIMKSLGLTKRDPPEYKDPFWEIREMISL